MTPADDSYVDGVDILYSTNTFHLSEMELQLNLPRLLPGHSLARITSIELMWAFEKSYDFGYLSDNNLARLWMDPTRQDTTLHYLCTMLPEAFPHLRRLYISFQCWVDPPFPKRDGDGDGISDVEAVVLGPVERMLRVLGPARGKEFNVAIQRTGWYVLFKKYQTLLGSKLRFESVDDLVRGRFWKPLGPLGAVEHDAHGCYNEDADFGYWICGGWDDYPIHAYWLPEAWGYKWTGAPETDE